MFCNAIYEFAVDDEDSIIFVECSYFGLFLKNQEK